MEDAKTVSTSTTTTAPTAEAPLQPSVWNTTNDDDSWYVHLPIVLGICITIGAFAIILSLTCRHISHKKDKHHLNRKQNTPLIWKRCACARIHLKRTPIPIRNWNAQTCKHKCQINREGWMPLFHSCAHLCVWLCFGQDSINKFRHKNLQFSSFLFCITEKTNQSKRKSTFSHEYQEL